MLAPTKIPCELQVLERMFGAMEMGTMCPFPRGQSHPGFKGSTWNRATRPLAGVLFGWEQREGEVFGGGGAAFGGFFEGGVAAVEGVLGLAAVEDLLDG